MRTFCDSGRLRTNGERRIDRTEFDELRRLMAAALAGRHRDHTSTRLEGAADDDGRLVERKRPG